MKCANTAGACSSSWCCVFKPATSSYKTYTRTEHPCAVPSRCLALPHPTLSSMPTAELTALAVVAMVALCPVLCIAQRSGTQTCGPGNHLDTSGNYRGCCVPDDMSKNSSADAVCPATCPRSAGGGINNHPYPLHFPGMQPPFSHWKCDCELCQSCDYLQLVQQNPADPATCTERIRHCDCVNCQCTCDMATTACQLDATCPALVRALVSAAGDCPPTDIPPCAPGTTQPDAWLHCCVLPPAPHLVWDPQHQADCCANAACRNYVETASSTGCSTLSFGGNNDAPEELQQWGRMGPTDGFFRPTTNRDFFPTALTCPSPPPQPHGWWRWWRWLRDGDLGCFNCACKYSWWACLPLCVHSKERPVRPHRNGRDRFYTTGTVKVYWLKILLQAAIFYSLV
eukprot:COSAG05_NODE_264_length_12674_cov_6.768111_9_plen_398_part_00